MYLVAVCPCIETVQCALRSVEASGRQKNYIVSFLEDVDMKLITWAVKPCCSQKEKAPVVPRDVCNGSRGLWSRNTVNPSQLLTVQAKKGREAYGVTSSPEITIFFPFFFASETFP